EEAAKFVKTERKNWDLDTLVFKDDSSLVTSIDQAVENMIVGQLSEILPGSAFIAEEFHSDYESADIRWILDPIDGTTNLVHNIPAYCISLGLEVEEKMVL